MKKIITLYHGSEKIVEAPAFGEGKRSNDFGLGFYCTENEIKDGKTKEILQNVTSVKIG